MNGVLEDSSKLSPEELEAYCIVLSVSGNQVSRAGPHPPCLSKVSLPAPLKTALDNWNANIMTDFPANHAWVSLHLFCSFL